MARDYEERKDGSRKEEDRSASRHRVPLTSPLGIEREEVGPDGLPRVWTRDIDLVCLSHLRWDFVYQRPQHLMTRCASTRRVFFIEEPVFHDGAAQMVLTSREDSVLVGVPHLPHGKTADEYRVMQRALLDVLFTSQAIHNHVLWYYTPMALGFSDHLSPLAIVYDCMDELSAFKGAPPELREYEARLFERADVVFTGGQSLYEAKKAQHANVHAMPSSIDREHFAQALDDIQEPDDQKAIPGPKLGFCGVIDERMDIALLDEMARLRPDWQFVMIGPVVKIDPATLPRRENIHYLGGRLYADLPAYLSGWDVALMPFALNESTRYISPTKTPEYLAAGKPVVSTPIHDVVEPYGRLGLVRIGSTAEEFVQAIDQELTLRREYADEVRTWWGRVDTFLSALSWDSTWSSIERLIDVSLMYHVSDAVRNGDVIDIGPTSGTERSGIDDIDADRRGA